MYKLKKENSTGSFINTKGKRVRFNAESLNKLPKADLKYLESINIIKKDGKEGSEAEGRDKNLEV